MLHDDHPRLALSRPDGFPARLVIQIPRVTSRKTFPRRLLGSLVQWIDSDYSVEPPEVIRALPDGVNWVRCLPFVILHAGCLGVIWTGGSWFAAGAAIALYFIRMFAVTGVYHRYFSHKTYSTSRSGQFLLALLGATCVQRGALWWAYHHRHHHQHSDEPADAHSPHVHGFWWSHIGWITSRRNFPTDYTKVRDLAKYPELVFLNRFDILVPVLFATGLFLLGRGLEASAPALHTSGAQLLVWGFFISTTALFHGTSCINSLAHLKGVPASIYAEAAQRHHQDTVVRFSMSSVQHEINTLRRVVPTAAAIALATVNSAQMLAPKKADGPAIHKDVRGLLARESSPATPPGSET
jgi:fatty-acid desaturase